MRDNGHGGRHAVASIPNQPSISSDGNDNAPRRECLALMDDLPIDGVGSIQ